MESQLKDFVAGEPMSSAAFLRFGSRLTSELRDFWLIRGTGSFAGGFLRVIDPAEISESFVKRFKGSPQENHVPIFATAASDLVTFDGRGTYHSLNFSRGTTAEMGVRLGYLLQDLQNPFFQREMLEPSGFEELRENNSMAGDRSYYSSELGSYGSLSEILGQLQPSPLQPN